MATFRMNGTTAMSKSGTDISIASGVTNNAGVASGTIASGVVFPTGHILQVVDATLSNVETAETPRTSETVVANATNQITITSGNKVLVYAQVTLRGVASSNAVFHARIREGTDTTGTLISESGFMNNSTSATFHTPHYIFALDDSPASTTPNYTLTMLKGSGGTSNVQLYSADSSVLKIILMEVKA